MAKDTESTKPELPGEYLGMGMGFRVGREVLSGENGACLFWGVSCGAVHHKCTIGWVWVGLYIKGCFRDVAASEEKGHVAQQWKVGLDVC